MRAVQEAGLVARVVAQVLARVQTESMPTGTRLPSERVLAVELGVSRNTITAAYAELQERGVLRQLHGKGSYLCALPLPRENFSWSGKVSNRANAQDEPVLELLARRCAGDIAFPFSAGTPSLAAFPLEQYRQTCNEVLEHDVPAALAVAPAEGQWVLREALGQFLGVPPQQVMITAGAQEGIDLLARCLIEPGDVVIVESPTYPGAIQSFRSAGAQLVSWQVDAGQGNRAWSLTRLEQLLLRYQPKCIFVMPTFQNPTGLVMDEATRRGLLELAHRYRVPVIEDDVYAELAFDGRHGGVPSLHAMDTCSQVVQLSTFSKTLAPGLRVGWLVAPLYLIKQLALIKMRSNLFTAGFNQYVLAAMLHSGVFRRHMITTRAHHANLCAVAVRALQPAVDEGLLRFQVPGGGLYLWCEYGQRLEPELLFSTLEEAGVSVAPGSAFQPQRERTTPPAFRICFTACEPHQLQHGLAALVSTLRHLQNGLKKHSTLPKPPLLSANVREAHA